MDDLALMINKGFKEVDSRFANLESRIENIEGTMATKDDIRRLEKRFISIEKIIFDDHEIRISNIEKKLEIA